jgi:hypothetical protein
VKQLDTTALYVVISPRFSLSETGHFYWNTLAYRDAFRNLNLDYRIIVPSFEGAENFLSQNPKFLMLDIGDTDSFGHDNGLISPLHLAQVIGRLIRDVNHEQDIYVLSFESSLTLYISLIHLSNRDSRIRVSLNLLDFGFWEKLLKMKQPGFRWLVKELKAATSQNSSNFHVFANSGSQPKLFSQLLGTKVFPWPIISVSTNRTHNEDLTLDSNEFVSKRLLVFPHADDLEVIKQLLDHGVNRGDVQNWIIDVHCKNLSDFQSVQEVASKFKMSESSLSYGYLDEESYSKKFEDSAAVLIPYIDQLHMHSGSGKAMDSLGHGRPIIALRGTHSCEIACKVGACFTLEEVTAKAIVATVGVINSSDAITRKSVFRSKIRKNASTFLSPESSLREIVSTFDSETAVSQPTERALLAKLSFLWFLIFIGTKVKKFVRVLFRRFTL